MRWREFELVATDIASVGKSLLFKAGQGEVAILATVNGAGCPRVAPVCPIFSSDGVYLSVTSNSPKLSNLRATSCYALHAQVGADDREFQITGNAREVTDQPERAAVHEAIQFPDFDPDDPVFELLIASALAVDGPLEGRKKLTWRA